MLNVGGLVRYPRGAGGIVLCNLKFLEPDDAPENPEKKRAILAGMLRNLKAPFAGGRTIIAGARLAYAPRPFEAGQPIPHRARLVWR